MTKDAKARLLCGGLVGIGAFSLGLLFDVGGSSVPVFWGIPPIILIGLGLAALGTEEETKK